MYFQNYRLRKTWLDQCLKSSVSQHPSTDNTVNGPQHYCNLNDRTLQYLLITLKVVSLEKVPFSNIQNRKTVF